MSANAEQLLATLNQALTLEYTLIIHYPRLASMIQDADTRKLVNELGSASVKHADVVATAITSLGGKANWSFHSFPPQVDLVDIFRTQLEKEKMARDLHQQSAHMVTAGKLRDRFEEIAKEEETHIKTVEKILKRLTALKQ